MIITMYDVGAYSIICNAELGNLIEAGRKMRETRQRIAMFSKE